MRRGPPAVAPHHLENRGMGMRIRDCRNMPCFQCMDDRLLDERACAIEDAERPECQSEIGHRRGGHILAEAEDEFAISHGIVNRQRLLQMSSAPQQSCPQTNGSCRKSGERWRLPATAGRLSTSRRKVAATSCIGVRSPRTKLPLHSP